MKFGIRQQLFFCKSVKIALTEVTALKSFFFFFLFVKIYLNKTLFTLFLSLIFLSSNFLVLSFFDNILYIILPSATDDMSYFFTIIFFAFSSRESSISVSIGIFIYFSRFEVFSSSFISSFFLDFFLLLFLVL